MYVCMYVECAIEQEKQSERELCTSTYSYMQKRANLWYGVNRCLGLGYIRMVVSNLLWCSYCAQYKSTRCRPPIAYVPTTSHPVSPLLISNVNRRDE